MMAAYKNNINMVRLLLDKGANVSAADEVDQYQSLISIITITIIDKYLCGDLTFFVCVSFSVWRHRLGAGSSNE